MTADVKWSDIDPDDLVVVVCPGCWADGAPDGAFFVVNEVAAVGQCKSRFVGWPSFE